MMLFFSLTLTILIYREKKANEYCISNALCHGLLGCYNKIPKTG